MSLVAITSIIRAFTLLPHFIAHYRGLGVDRIAAVCVSSVRDDVISQYGDQVEVIPASNRLETTHMDGANKNEARQVLGLTRDDWLIPADLDEYVEFPLPLPAMIERLKHKQCCYAHGRFLDRITLDGTLAADRPLPLSLFEQYPLACNISAKMQMNCNKVVLSRGDVELRSGHHWPVNPRLQRGYKNIPVHHFKWREGIVPALEKRIVNYCRAGRSDVAGESRRVLDYLRKHDGRFVPEDFGAVLRPLVLPLVLPPVLPPAVSVPVEVNQPEANHGDS